MVGVLCWLLALAGAYESDSLTDRQIPLANARPALNLELDALLALAIERTNHKTGCEAGLSKTRRVLARQFARITAHRVWVMKRGVLRAPGFGAYTAWIERSDLDMRSWKHREDLYGDATLWHSVILTMAGPASTVSIDGILVGTDKFDHFLASGYDAWKLSGEGRRPDKVYRWDKRTERHFFGLITSKTYSYGDIAANDDGFVFYRGLLGAGSLVQRDQDGCVHQVRPFDWAEWVDWRYDEALNPSVYTKLVQKAVTKRIEREPARYCAAWEALGGHGYDVHLAELLHGSPPPVKRMDARIDPYGLGALCQ